MNLSHWNTKFQDKRKQTPFRDFVMEICSWYSLIFHKNMYGIAKMPVQERVKITSTREYYKDLDNHILDRIQGNDFFGSLKYVAQMIGTVSLYSVGETENSNFADLVHASKNIYLSSNVVYDCDSILYCFNAKQNVSNAVSSNMIYDGSSNIYNSRGIFCSFDIFCSEAIQNSSFIWFSQNLIGCIECINCSNLSNISYAINNNTLSKDEYLKKKKEILGNKSLFIDHNFASETSNKEILFDCENVVNASMSYQVRDSRNIAYVGSKEGNHSCYDVFGSGSGGAGDMYGCIISGGGGDHYYNCILVGFSSYMYYCWDCMSCSFCLGCIGLKNKSYYILNKQYTKEEWYQKVDEIFSQMEADGTLGQFFPASMNPFYFNDTAAYLIDPSFTKEEVTARGYLWRDEPIKVDIPADAEVVKSGELQRFEGFDEQGNRTINADILKKVIQDEQGNYYRIIPMEYKFLMKHGLPLPRKHWLERMKENFRIN